jgi:hypothetical protein
VEEEIVRHIRAESLAEPPAGKGKVVAEENGLLGEGGAVGAELGPVGGAHGGGGTVAEEDPG